MYSMGNHSHDLAYEPYDPQDVLPEPDASMHIMLVDDEDDYI